MSEQNWQDQLKLILSDETFTTPEDVTPEKFKNRMDAVESELTIPGALQDGLSSYMERVEESEAPVEGQGQDPQWQSFIRNLWALAYLDDPDQERWLKAYSEEKWAEAHPNQRTEDFIGKEEELTRLRQRFVYRNVAANYERVFNWRSTTFPGWII